MAEGTTIGYVIVSVEVKGSLTTEQSLATRMSPIFEDYESAKTEIEKDKFYNTYQFAYIGIHELRLAPSKEDAEIETLTENTIGYTDLTGIVE